MQGNGLWIGLAVVAGFLALKWWQSRRTPEQLQAIADAIKAGATVLDVRSAGEFAGGHLPGARNVPVGDLSRRLKEVGAKDKPVVVYCLSGARSRAAAGVLRQGGFKTVHDLGPMTNGHKLPAGN